MRWSNLLLIVILLTGCANEITYKGIPSAEVPVECAEFKDEPCELFSCMTKSCWCNPGDNGRAIVYEKEETLLKSEGSAIGIVEEYLKEKGLEYEVDSAVEINNIFYNVFAYDEKRDEKVFTVAVDGTIMITMCGI